MTAEVVTMLEYLNKWRDSAKEVTVTKTFFVYPVKRSRNSDPTSYDVCFNSYNENMATPVAKFTPAQWGGIDGCKARATELAALLNGELEPVPYDVHRLWEPFNIEKAYRAKE